MGLNSDDKTASGWVVGVILFLVGTYHYILHPCLFSSLAKIPNAHWSTPLSRLWILRVRFQGRENKTLHETHRRLGPVIRIGPSELSIDDLEGVRTVYQGGFEKPVWYSVFDNYGVPCMFSARPAREHSARKRMISNVYAKSYIQSSSTVAAQARVILIDRLLPMIRYSASERQKPHGIDIYSVLMAATMDFIAGYIFGVEQGTSFLKNKAYRDHFFELYRARNDYSFYDQELPRVTAICRRLGFGICPSWVDAANHEMRGWCQQLCDSATKLCSAAGGAEAQADADEPLVYKTLVSGLEKETEAHGKDSLLYSTALAHREQSVASELFDHVLAGQETAGIALTYLSWRLSQSEDLQRELRDELLTLSPCLQFHDDGSAELPDAKQLDALPVLHAVIMETLRLHAPIPGPQPRQTPAPSCKIGPYKVPGGVRIAAMAYTLHRDEQVFPEPEKWDHTRWLPSHATEEERKERNRQFWAFSSGGRMCIGSNFAMHEMKLVTAAIYTNFISHIVNDTGVAEQSDGYTSRPGLERLYLRFEEVN